MLCHVLIQLKNLLSFISSLNIKRKTHDSFNAEDWGSCVVYLKINVLKKKRLVRVCLVVWQRLLFKQLFVPKYMSMSMIFFYFLKIIFNISTSKRSKKYKPYSILIKKNFKIQRNTQPNSLEMGTRKEENESRQKSKGSLVAQLTVMKHTLYLSIK